MQDNSRIAKLRRLQIYNSGLELIKILYDLTDRFPKSEQFGMVSQIRRAAISVNLNIAEGHGRRTIKENINFLTIAKGSIAELIASLDIAYELKYVSQDELASTLRSLQTLEIKIYNYIAALQR